MPRNWHDPRVPAPEECVVGPLLDKWAARKPDAPFIVLDDGRTLTYGEMRAVTIQTAIGLQSLGVKAGDHVLSWLPNGVDPIRIWFALNYIGAVYVPINLAYRGRLLEHVVENSDARLIVVHADLVERLGDIDRAKLETAVVIGGEADPVEGLDMRPENSLTPQGGNLVCERDVMPWDPMKIIYTSGTTGPSKGVLCSYLQLYTMSGIETNDRYTEGDRFMVNLPMFHVGGTMPVFSMLILGGSVSLVDSFKTGEFWDVVERTETTICVLLGVMAPFLMKQPSSADDAKNCLKSVIMVPLPDDVQQFSDRFGVDVYTAFNMTEISSPIQSEANPKQLGACGRMRDGFDLRIVDENDCEVAPGEIGELIVRTDRPWGLNSGYYKNPEATAKAWRNGWFHTGDAFKRDEEGNYYFVDRMKDAIRRRGENISSFEVEAEVLAHPDVNEAAVVAVPSEISEDEVMAVVAPVPGRTVDPGKLIEFLRPRMAHFMIPRYIRVMDDLPKTPTQKVKKAELRQDGVTSDTFDREAAGIMIKREKIGKSA